MSDKPIEGCSSLAYAVVGASGAAAVPDVRGWPAAIPESGGRSVQPAAENYAHQVHVDYWCKW